MWAVNGDCSPVAYRSFLGCDRILGNGLSPLLKGTMMSESYPGRWMRNNDPEKGEAWDFPESGDSGATSATNSTEKLEVASGSYPERYVAKSSESQENANSEKEGEGWGRGVDRSTSPRDAPPEVVERKLSGYRRPTHSSNYDAEVSKTRPPQRDPNTLLSSLSRTVSSKLSRASATGGLTVSGISIPKSTVLFTVGSIKVTSVMASAVTAALALFSVVCFCMTWLSYSDTTSIYFMGQRQEYTSSSENIVVFYYVLPAVFSLTMLIVGGAFVLLGWFRKVTGVMFLASGVSTLLMVVLVFATSVSLADELNGAGEVTLAGGWYLGLLMGILAIALGVAHLVLPRRSRPEAVNSVRT